MKTFAVGDLHGNFTELTELLGLLAEKEIFDANEDRLVFLGDYVDGYEKHDYAGLVNFLLTLHHAHPQFVFLRGNHEQLLLDALPRPRTDEHHKLWWYQGGKETYESYAKTYPDLALTGNPFPEEHITWFQSLPPYFETEDYIFVHAGLRPNLPPLLNGEEDMMWIREEFIESEADWGKTVVFGHTVQKEPLVMKNKIGIDTYSRKNGYLTIAELSPHRQQEPVFHTLENLRDKEENR